MVNLGVYVCGAIFAGTVSLASLPILNWLPSSSLFCEPGYNNKAQLHHLLPSPFSRSSVSFTFPSSVVSSHSSSLLNPSARFPLAFRTNSTFFPHFPPDAPFSTDWIPTIFQPSTQKCIRTQTWISSLTTLVSHVNSFGPMALNTTFMVLPAPLPHFS